MVHVPAGPFDLPKEALAEQVDVFADGVGEHIEATGGVDVIHGNYWLSGVAGHRLKHRFDVPLVSTFHTLARVKAEGGDLEPEWRDRAEAEVIGCSDAICVSCPEEERQFRRLYGDPHGVIETVPPAVEHAFFAPGDRRGARRAIGLPADRPIILFVGRIQPLKGPDVAVRTARRAAPPRRRARPRRRRQRRRRRRRAGGDARPRPPSWASPTASCSSSRSRTTCCRATTAPPTS